MNVLVNAVDSIEQWGGDRQEDRKECTLLMEQIAQHMDAAIQVWEGYLEAPTTAEGKLELLYWIGSQRTRNLYELHLKAKQAGLRLAELTGVEELCSPLEMGRDITIEMAYRRLKPYESAIDAAKDAVELMSKRLKRIHEQLARLR
jgi:hypothetical protein